MIKTHTIKEKNGFTLLFASLVVSLLLAVGLAILNITLQQLLLSSAGRESQFAFYNADSGIECALFYDKENVGGKMFATSSESANTYAEADIKCGGADIKDLSVDSDQTSATTIFSVTNDPTPNHSQCTVPSQIGDTFSMMKILEATISSISVNPFLAFS